MVESTADEGRRIGVEVEIPGIAANIGVVRDATSLPSKVVEVGVGSMMVPGSRSFMGRPARKLK
jgi:hypothetical protein